MFNNDEMALTMGNRSAYRRIQTTKIAKLLMHLPLNDTTGVIAKNHAPFRSDLSFNFELMQNGGFEQLGAPIGASGIFENFTGDAGATKETVDVHSGANAVKITATVADQVITSDYIHADGSTLYTIKAWVHGDGTIAPLCQVARLDWGAWLLSENTGVTGTTYQQYTGTFTVPAGYPYFQVRFTNPHNQWGSVYVDDISLTGNAIHTNQTIFDGIYYGNLSLAQPGLPGLSSVSLGGTDGKVLIGRPALLNYFNNIMSTGSYIIYGKTTIAALTDSKSRWMMKCKTGGGSTGRWLDCFEDSSNNKLGYQYSTDAHEQLYQTTSWTTEAPFSFGSTWSPANGYKMFLNGYKVGVTVPTNCISTSNWSGNSFALGNQGPATSDSWIGNIGNFALWDAELSEGEMYKIGHL